MAGWRFENVAGITIQQHTAKQFKVKPRREDRGQTLACNVGVHQIVPREGSLSVSQRPSVCGFNLFLKFTHESLVVLYKQLIPRGWPLQLSYIRFFSREVLSLLSRCYQNKGKNCNVFNGDNNDNNDNTIFE